MQIPSGHLTYCANIHAGESWMDHFAALDKNFPLIKSSLSPDAPMGIGLRLSNQASLALIQPDQLLHFKNWLSSHGGYVFTMNGFPYGGFHNTRVKDQVHAPDWTTMERVDYTIRLFDLLSELLPDQLEGGISTSPLSYRHWFPSPTALNHATQKATGNMPMVVEHLIRIHQTTGRLMHLDIEPEPDGILENGPEFIRWFEHELMMAGVPFITEKFDVSQPAAEALIRLHIRLCYDVCHFAIGHEPHAEIVSQLNKKGILIGKIQISAALKAVLPDDPLDRTAVKEAFASFDEPTYLHQVVAKASQGGLLRYRDLPEALTDINNSDAEEWRAHFHVPIFESHFGMLQSTQSDITQLLALHKKHSLTQHLEVETYTWEVIEEDLKLPIAESIIRELEWTRRELCL